MFSVLLPCRIIHTFYPPSKEDSSNSTPIVVPMNKGVFNPCRIGHFQYQNSIFALRLGEIKQIPLRLRDEYFSLPYTPSLGAKKFRILNNTSKLAYS